MKRRFRYVVVAALLIALAASCDDGSDARSRQSPTPVFEVDGVSISPPTAAAVALTDDAFHRGARMFVVDRRDGNVQTLGAALSWSSTDPIEWLDDDTLVAQLPASFVEIDLDGAIRGTAVTKPPGSGRGGILGTSPGGDWGVGWLSSAPGGLIVSVNFEPPRFRITNAMAAQWSPVEDLLVLTGNHCQGVDLFSFEPESANLVNLTADDSRSFLESFVWLGDGSAVAAPAQFGDPAPGGAIVLVDVRGGASATLAEAFGPFVTMRPLEWSPSGQRLLFLAGIGGPIPCRGDGEETVLDASPELGEP